MSGSKSEMKMSRKRTPTVEHRTTATVTMADKPKQSRKETASGYPATDEGKQSNKLSSLSQDSVTSTGDNISMNGIRLWGMW